MYKEVKKMGVPPCKVKLGEDASKTKKALGGLSKMGDDARKGLEMKVPKVR
jgi:hypothetical protein